MPDYLSIVAVEPTLEALPESLRATLPRYPATDDDLQTARVLREDLERIGKAAPELEVVVFYRSPIAWISLTAAGVRRGVVWEQALALSASDERAELVPGCAPDVPLLLDCAAERLLDEISVHAIGDVEADDCTLMLPFSWERTDDVLAALAVVAGHLATATARFVVEVDGSFMQAELSAGGGVTLRPLLVWHDDPSLRRGARQAFGHGAHGVTSRVAARAPEITAWDPARPFVTGSAARRLDAISDALPRRGRATVQPTPELFEALLAAAGDQANAEPRFADVRASLYEHVGSSANETVTGALALALEHEQVPDVRLAIVGELAKRSGAAAAQALVGAYRRDASLRERIGERLWRNDDAVELLVRSDLVAAWSGDRGYAKAIIALLDEEELRVPQEWIEGADESLRRALHRLLD